MCAPGTLETPRFTKEPVDLIYLGSMSESHQELAIRRLLPHAGVLRQYVESGGVLLATGNALELFGTYIQEGKRQIPALGLFPCHAVRDMEHRHNSMFLGTFGDMKIVGARSQFSFSYGDFPHPFLQVTGGYGIYPEARVEGIHYKNFFATYLLGPFLVLNPQLHPSTFCSCWAARLPRPFGRRPWRPTSTVCGGWRPPASASWWASTADEQNRNPAPKRID